MTGSNAAPSKIIPNSYQKPNFLVDDLMRLLSGSEHKCVDVVCRKTFGWQKRSDRISKSQIMELTGLGEGTVDQCMAGLTKYGVVIQVSANASNLGIEWAMQLDDSLIDLQGLQEREQKRRCANHKKTAVALEKRGVGMFNIPTMSNIPPGGDVQHTPQKPVKTKIQEEEEEKAPRVFAFSSELQAELKDLGVFVSTWQHVEKQLAAGWTETDVLALVDWVTKTRKDKAKAAQGFVTRVREGTKAPSEYYDFAVRKMAGRWYPGKAVADAAAPAPEPEETEPEYYYLQADETITPEIERAWQSCLDQLSRDMPRASFNTWLQGTQPVHFETGCLEIGTRNAYTRDWLESRLASTVSRLLVGIMNQSVAIEFVVGCSVAAETVVE